MRVWITPNELDHARFGVSVGRRHGNAVRRNRLKRVAREAFRQALGEFPPSVDIICIPRWKVELTCADCTRSMTRLVRKAAERMTAADA
jgi:ribonuclease P protein component